MVVRHCMGAGSEAGFSTRAATAPNNPPVSPAPSHHVTITAAPDSSGLQKTSLKWQWWVINTEAFPVSKTVLYFLR